VTKTNLETTLESILDFETLKYCFECGICTASCAVAELLPEHYNPRILLHSLPLADDSLLNSPELWLCAWCYRCYRRCPQDLKLPEIFHAVRRFAVESGHMEGFGKALEIIREKLPLPASCCYVCFHPERAIDNSQSVTEAIKQVILGYGTETLKKPFSSVHGEKVAVVGSGPAGLSAAHDLARMGYSVTVFEASSSPGGMLRRCIPGYRLPKRMVDSDVRRIKALGVKIKTNTAIGESLKMEQLLEKGYKAVFVATGAHEEHSLGVEGEELGGVFYALEFLEKANMKEVVLSGNVAVIGGGNVAVDSAVTASRLGAKEITILYRRSKAEMPASPWEIKEAEEAGAKIEFLVAPKRFLGEKGKVTGIECVRMELGEPDETGRGHPVPIQGSEFIIETGTVIIAIGQFPSTVFLPETVEVTEKRTIAADPFTLETGSPGIFAGGDAVSGPSNLMDAIVAGKRAAVSIDLYLRDVSLQPRNLVENVLEGVNGSL
jgi:NADPH-dependent glutamate synthase beta subunit-like oxidoreductase